MPDLVRKAIAEAIGTFFLCFIGVSAICSDQVSGGKLGLVGIALAHGLALSIAISALGNVSGGHFNPAVTIGFLATKRICPKTTAAYIIGQLLGSILAGVVAGIGFAPTVMGQVGGGVPAPGAGVSDMTVILFEAVATFLLVTAIWGTAVDPKAPKIGGFGIGLTVAFDILAIGPITGASMNPARTFGPGLAAGVWTSHYAYWVGPILGAVVAAVLYKNLFLSSPESESKPQ